MHWKAIAAGALGALMAGSTLAFAQDLGNLPAPFVQDSTVNALFVVGEAAATDDVVGAIDVAARWGGAPVTSQQVSIPGIAAALAVDGEGREIGTRTQPIFLGTPLRKSGLRSTMTDTDMPTILRSDTVFDTDANDEYDYDQFIQFSDDFPLTFSRVSGEETDPSYKFGEFGTSASPTDFFYRTRLIFTDEVNMSTVVNEDIDILGATYTVSPETDEVCDVTANLVLFGAADTRLLKEGESVTVTVEGVQRTVQLITVGETSVGISVDGETKSLSAGQTTTLAGVSIFIEDIFFSAKEAVASQAEVGIGAREITLNGDGQVEVGLGGDTDFIDGTFVELVCSDGALAQVDVFITAEDSDGDFLTIGGEWVDPVWGSFKVAFPTIVPAADDPARDSILLDPAGDDDIELTMTTDRGDRNTINWAHSTDPTSIDGDLILADDNEEVIHVVEGETMDRDEFFVTDAGEFSRMFEVTGVSSLGTPNAEVRIRDVFTGDTIEVVLGEDDLAEKVIDGQSYFFNVTGTTDAPVISVTWGDGASAVSTPAVDPGFPGATGDFITVYPVLKTEFNDEGIALTEPVSVPGLDSGEVYLVNLPTGTVEVDVAGATVDIAAATTEEDESSTLTFTAGSDATIGVGPDFASFRLGRTSGGGAFYNLTWDGSDTLSISMADSGTSAVTDPAVLLVEEEDDDSNVGSLLFAAGWDASDDETDVEAPINTTLVESGTREGDTDIEQSVDLWGTWFQRDTSDQSDVQILYPDEQVSAAVFVLAREASVGADGAVAGRTVTTQSVVPIKTPLAKTDTEVTSSDRSTKNLVLFGGPAINTLVAELAAAGKTWDVERYRAEGAGNAIVQMVADAFAGGRAALIVAGHSGPDTRAASRIVQLYDDNFAQLSGQSGVLVVGGSITGPIPA